MSKPDRIILFHGTSSQWLPRLLTTGFVPEPPVRLSILMGEAEDGPGSISHLDAFNGTYLTASRDFACSYARNAKKHMGGEGMVVAFSVPITDLIPDEDEVLFSLACPLAKAMGWDADDPDRILKPWSKEVALEAATELVGGFDVPGVDAPARVAASLHAMVSALIGLRWDRKPALFDPEKNVDGWASPTWVKRLTSTPKGLALYRMEMDKLTHAMVGADPWSYPCSLESCKGRITTPISTSSIDGAFIVAVGSEMEPTVYFDGLSALTGNEVVDSYSERWLRPTAALVP